MQKAAVAGRRRTPPAVVDVLVVALAAAEAVVNLWDTSPVGIAFASLGCAGLLLRRPAPVAAFALTLPSSLVQDLAVPPVVALLTLAMTTKNRQLLASCAALSALASTVPSPLDRYADPGAGVTVYFFYKLAAAVAPVLLGQLVVARREAIEQLQHVRHFQEQERRTAEQNLLARERAQLAREMHDVVAHQISLIAVQAGAMQVAAMEPHLRDSAAAIRERSVSTLDELRTMVTLLRASGGAVNQLAPQPTLRDLPALVASAGQDVRLSGELPSTLSSPVQRTIYRTIQEGLTNARKHASGSPVEVCLRLAARQVQVTISNGAARAPLPGLPGGQQGLRGLTERAQLVGGTLAAAPLPDGGFELRLKIPVLQGWDVPPTDGVLQHDHKAR